MKKLIDLLTAVQNEQHKSSWKNGVKEYAIELIENMIENNGNDFEFYGSAADKKTLLNGANNWKQYSFGGCSLIYDIDIAERLCNQTELKRSKNGEKDPNKNETWLDCQARALLQAENMIIRIAKIG